MSLFEIYWQAVWDRDNLHGFWHAERGRRGGGVTDLWRYREHIDGDEDVQRQGEENVATHQKPRNGIHHFCLNLSRVLKNLKSFENSIIIWMVYGLLQGQMRC